MRYFVYTPAHSLALDLERIFELNGSDYKIGYRTFEGAEGRHRIILNSRTPTELALEEYSWQGYTQSLVIDTVVNLGREMADLAQHATEVLAEYGDGCDTFTVWREDCVKPSQWSRAVGLRDHHDLSFRPTITVANSQEILNASNSL